MHTGCNDDGRFLCKLGPCRDALETPVGRDRQAVDLAEEVAGRCCSCCAGSDSHHENLPSSPRCDRTIRLRWLLLPARRDRAGGALVPTLRAVVSRHRGAARRTRHRRGSRHGLPLGPAIHADAGRGRPPCRHAVGDRWQVDETYVKVAGHWRYVYRAIDQFGQVIDAFMSTRRDAAAARRFFKRAISTTKVTPIEVVTDRAPAYLTVLDDLLEATWHRTERYANNRVEADHGRLKHGWGRCKGANRNSAPAS